MIEIVVYRLPTNNELRKEVETQVWIRGTKPGIFEVQVSAPGGFKEHRGKYPAAESVKLSTQIWWPRGEADVQGLVAKVLGAYSQPLVPVVRTQLARHLHDLKSEWLEQLFANFKVTSKGSLLHPSRFVVKCKQRMLTAFVDLSPDAQQEVFDEADRVLSLLAYEGREV